ncbi:hypothetical protein MATL_G00059220 [Megalops atlanticus]|uniref:Trans-golgi network protein 2 n=1 Tax=Megalops atlanticus TaxID=7932 RepID=A0A9D3TFS7_MEGAT|nr:hypothetical protein MATL_G00059220 [Megalops atlanticus]
MRVTFIVFTMACLCCAHGIPTSVPPKTTGKPEQVATSKSTPTDKPAVTTGKGDGQAAKVAEKVKIDNNGGGNMNTKAEEKSNVTKNGKEDANVNGNEGWAEGNRGVKPDGGNNKEYPNVEVDSSKGDPQQGGTNAEESATPKSNAAVKAEGTKSPGTKVDGGNSEGVTKADSKTDPKDDEPDTKEDTKKPAENNEKPGDNERKGDELPVDNKQVQTTKASPVEQTTIKVGGTTKEEDEDDEYSEEGDENAIVEPNEKSDSVQEPPSGRQNHPSVPGDEAESSHFFAYLVSTAVLVAVLYIGYHNKRKIIAYVVEGRRSRSSRRPKGTEYQKLQQSM